MLTLFRAVLVGLALCLGSIAPQTAHAAPTSTVLIEQTGSTGSPHSSGGRFPIITVDRPIAITAFAEWVDIADGAAISFVFYKKVGGVWVQDRAPIATTASVASGPAYEQSPSFAPYILEPGQSYLLGMISAGAHTPYHNGGSGMTANGITLGASGVFHDYSPPTFQHETGFSYTLKLIGYEVPPVPTMTQWAMILMGIALAGAAGISLRRRKTL